MNAGDHRPGRRSGTSMRWSRVDDLVDPLRDHLGRHRTDSVASTARARVHGGGRRSAACSCSTLALQAEGAISSTLSRSATVTAGSSSRRCGSATIERASRTGTPHDGAVRLLVDNLTPTKAKHQKIVLRQAASLHGMIDPRGRRRSRGQWLHRGRCERCAQKIMGYSVGAPASRRVEDLVAARAGAVVRRRCRRPGTWRRRASSGSRWPHQPIRRDLSYRAAATLTGAVNWG